MYYVEKLPFILALAAAVFTGIAGKVCGVENEQSMIRMLIAALIFLLTGLYLRHTLFSISREQIVKKYRKELDKHKIDYRVDSDDFTPLDKSSYVKPVNK